jgi:hypothetical protein
MSSFTDTLGLLAAAGVHKKRKSADADHAEEVRAALAKQWKEKDRPAALEVAKSNAAGVYKMKVSCEHEIHEWDMLKLLPEELADDVKRHQIDCHKHDGWYFFEFYFGHKRDAFLDEMERDDPSPFAKTRRFEGKGGEEEKAELEGDAALFVKDEEVTLTPMSVAERVQRVRDMTLLTHRAIMATAAEELGFPVTPWSAPGLSLELAWERALLQGGREASLAYAAAMAEVEALEASLAYAAAMAEVEALA